MLEILTPRTHSYTHDHSQSRSSSPSSSPTQALAASTMTIATSTSGLDLSQPPNTELKPGNLSPTTSVSPRNSLTPPTISTIPPPDSTSLNTLLSLASQRQLRQRSSSVVSTTSDSSDLTSTSHNPDILLSHLVPSTQTIIHFRPARSSDLDGIADVRSLSAGIIFSDRENARSKEALAKRNEAAVEAAYHDLQTVMLVAEVAGLLPGSSRRGSVVSNGTWDNSLDGSAIDEAKPKPPKRQIVGVLELRWEGGVCKDSQHETRGSTLRPLINKAKALATRSRSRRNSVESMSPDLHLGLEIPNDHWAISMLVVHPLHQGRGVGSSLLTLALEACQSRDEVVGIATTLGTQAWFEKRGLMACGEVKNEGKRWVAMVRRPEQTLGGGIAELQA